jgi:hypothetical protein
MLPRDLGRRAATFTHGDGMAREIKGVTASYQHDQCHVRFVPAASRPRWRKRARLRDRSSSFPVKRRMCGTFGLNTRPECLTTSKT